MVTLHLDVSWQQWSESLSSTPRFGFTYRTPSFGPGERTFDDTLAVRLGAEVSMSDRWRLYLGVADEESFQPGDAFDPGFPAGAATVFGIGAGWRGQRLGIDAGMNLVDIDDRQGAPNEYFATDRTELTISLRFAR